MKDDKFQRDMARLEAARRRTHHRMAAQQARIDKRFERMKHGLARRHGVANDAQQRIIDAALELLSAGGLPDITLRKLADRLDLKAPALYWHFANKEVLVDYLAEAILQKEFKTIEPRRDDESWQDWLRDHMVRLRQAMLAYPDGARVVAGAHLYPAVTLAKSLEAGLISLSSAGVELDRARVICITATNYTFGYVIEEQASPSEEEVAEFDLAGFLEPYPHIAKSLGTVGRGPDARDRDYLRGLDYIIAGASQK